MERFIANLGSYLMVHHLMVHHVVLFLVLRSLLTTGSDLANSGNPCFATEIHARHIPGIGLIIPMTGS